MRASGRGTCCAVVAACALVAMACSQPAAGTPWVRGEVALARIVDTLPACELPPVGDTVGWSRREQSSVLLPAGFAVDTSVEFFHGGRLWRDGSREYSEGWGVYGPISFARDGSRCRALLAGRPALVIVGPRGVTVWPVDTSPHRNYTVLLTGKGADPGDRELLLRVLQTYRPR